MKNAGKSVVLYSAYVEHMRHGLTEPEHSVGSENTKYKNIQCWIRMDRNLKGIQSPLKSVNWVWLENKLFDKMFPFHI